MKILKWTLGSLLAVIVLIIAIAYLLPNQYGLSRSITINASADKIFPLIAAPKEWKKWSVWNQRDPAMQMTYSGAEVGNGAAWEWQSQSQGNGGMKFNNVVENQQVGYELHFEGMGQPSTGAITLVAEGNATKITWSMQGTSEGSFMTKLFAPFMDKLVGPDFEAGLKNLKALVEKT
jgi:uncharacterized protein YndB with AHSA1/START domain